MTKILAMYINALSNVNLRVPPSCPIAPRLFLVHSGSLPSKHIIHAQKTNQ